MIDDKKRKDPKPPKKFSFDDFLQMDKKDQKEIFKIMFRQQRSDKFKKGGRVVKKKKKKKKKWKYRTALPSRSRRVT